MFEACNIEGQKLFDCDVCSLSITLIMRIVMNTTDFLLALNTLFFHFVYTNIYTENYFR